ncbi:MAG: tyrosine-type recombinase/integrase [Eggerthellales bacterium]|nr:tyrosine-type recombinase/integrase [Eggerthellales bacterium]
MVEGDSRVAPGAPHNGGAGRRRPEDGHSQEEARRGPRAGGPGDIRAHRALLQQGQDPLGHRLDEPLRTTGRGCLRRPRKRHSNPSTKTGQIHAAMGREASGGCLLAREISPHAFRHSKAMHMLEAGVGLIYIRDFLGHASVKTTEVYAKTNPEVKRRTIEAHCAELGLPQKTFTAAEEKSIIEKLRALGKSSA